MKTAILTSILLLLLTTGLYAGPVDTLRFDYDRLIIDHPEQTVRIQNMESISEDNQPSAPVVSRFYEADISVNKYNLIYKVIRADTLEIPFAPRKCQPDKVTSDRIMPIRKIPFLKNKGQLYPARPVEQFFYRLGEKQIINLTLFPVQYLGNNRIIFNREIVIISDAPISPSAPGVMRSAYKPTPAPKPSFSPQGTCPLGNDLIIITSPQLAEAFQSYLTLKLRTGFDAALVLTDDIYATYSAFDPAESIRNYLKDFYNAGGQYVLMGGDESQVPIRYAYYYNTATPQSLDRQMICDLYFADLTGDWDYDHDGVFGEPTEDQPDLGAELLVGRLPFSQPLQVQQYTAKMESYIFNPGRGNRDYLNSSVFFTSDQMRDYFEGGQQYKVAEVFPAGFATDCETLAESPTGIDPAPLGPSGELTITTMNSGYGIVNILAHGRPDGYVLNSSAYNEYPKQYIMTGSRQPVHALITDLPKDGNISFYYTISCEQGAIDLETVYSMDAVSVVEELLALDSAGAVGIVAFSRWGWVASSYKLMVAFYQHLFGDADGNAAAAMYLSYLDYPYYRDQIYNQNFYGDPSLSVYTDQPGQAVIETEPEYSPGGIISGTVKVGDVPQGNHTVTLLAADEYQSGYVTDNEGRFEIPVDGGCIENLILSTYCSGQVAGSVQLFPSIVADADDDDNPLPAVFALQQNFPNPFNPATTVRFSLSRSGQASVKVFNIAGQLVDIVVDDFFTAGEHEIVWDGRDRSDYEVASGIYLYHLISDEGIQTRKMCLIR